MSKKNLKKQFKQYFEEKKEKKTLRINKINNKIADTNEKIENYTTFAISAYLIITLFLTNISFCMFMALLVLLTTIGYITKKLVINILFSKQIKEMRYLEIDVEIANKTIKIINNL